MLRNTYCLDFGSYEIKLYNPKLDKNIKIKDTLAIQNKKNILAIGDSAYDMFEKSPSNIEVVFPMKEGVISHFHDMQHILTEVLKETKNSILSTKYIIAVPTDVTEVEKKAFHDLVNDGFSRSKSVKVVERGIADAVGLGVDLKNEPGTCIINFGSESTEVSVIATGGMVLNKLIKVGGKHIDLEIQNSIKQSQDYLIGQLTAESLRRKFGLNQGDALDGMKVPGRNLLLGVPEFRLMAREDIEKIIQNILGDVLVNIDNMLERTPPLILRNIRKNGIYICGGCSKLIGLKDYLEEYFNCTIHTIDEPEYSGVLGLAKIMNTSELSKMSYSMNKQNNRWSK